MVLEGVVTNVANFGAFVDIGVHQDGLVHISALSNRYVKDPRDVVRVGQTVQVKVMEVDLNRKRVGLSMRLDDTPGENATPAARHGGKPSSPKRPGASKNSNQAQPSNNAMAAAFAKLKQK